MSSPSATADPTSRAVSGDAGDVERVLARVLDVAGEVLDMDIAWVSEINGGDYTLRAAQGATDTFGVEAGTTVPLEATYCARVMGGTLPNAIPDVPADARVAGMDVTGAMGVGAYVGVPIVLDRGEVFGTLCCLSHDPDATLGPKDVRFLEVVARVAGEELTRERAARRRRDERHARVAAAIRGEDVRIVLQPIVDLRTMRVVAVEALSRFAGPPASPADWFADAARAGLGEELELAVIERALAALDALPAGVRLSVNASAQTACSERLLALLDGPHGPRVQVEITEQTAVADYDELLAAIARLRATGARIAVDDAGAGYAGLRHILRVSPEVIKLDIALTRDIDTDPARAAMAASLVAFADRAGATIVAEGIETQGELDALVRLGIGAGQGYLLGRPGPLPLAPIPVRPTPRALVAAQPVPEGAASTAFAGFVRPLLEDVIAITGLESSYLTLRGYEDSTLEHRYVHNAGDLEVPTFTIPWCDSMCSRCQERGLVWTADVSGDLGGGGPAAEQAGIQTFLSVPVHVAGQVLPIGTLCALGREERYLSTGDVERVRALAERVGGELSRDSAA